MNSPPPPPPPLMSNPVRQDSANRDGNDMTINPMITNPFLRPSVVPSHHSSVNTSSHSNLTRIKQSLSLFSNEASSITQAQNEWVPSSTTSQSRPPPPPHQLAPRSDLYNLDSDDENLTVNPMMRNSLLGSDHEPSHRYSIDTKEHPSLQRLDLPSIPPPLPSVALEGIELEDLSQHRKSRKPPRPSCSNSRYSNASQDSISSEEEGELGCKCCWRTPRCRQFWARKRVQQVTGVLVFLLLGLLGYGVFVIFELMKLQNAEQVLNQVEIWSLCSTSVEFTVGGTINNPTIYDVAVHSIDSKVRLKDDPEMLGEIHLEPKFNAGSEVFESSTVNKFLIQDHAFRIDSIPALSRVLTPFLSQDNFVVVAETDIEATIWALGFPLTTTTTVELELEMNIPEEEAAAATLDASGDPSIDHLKPDTPIMESVTISSYTKDGPLTNGTISNEVLNFNINITLFSTQVGLNVQLPALQLIAYYDDIHMASVGTKAFSYTNQVTTEFDVMIDELTQVRLENLQTVVEYYSKNVSMLVGAKGLDTSTTNTSASSCMLQQALNGMEPATLEFIPEPYDATAAAATSSSTSSGSSSTSTAEKSIFTPVELVLSDIFRGEQGTTSTEEKLEVHFNFSAIVALTFDVLGELPSVYMDIYSEDDVLAYLAIEPVELHLDHDTGLNKSYVSCSIHALNETLAWERLFTTGVDIPTLDMSLRGRRGQNIISSILYGYQINITESMGYGDEDSEVIDDDTAAQNSTSSTQTTLESLEMEVSITNEPERIDVEVTANLALLASELRVVIPGWDLAFYDAAEGESNMIMSISMSEFQTSLPSANNSDVFASLFLTVSQSMAKHLGQFVNDFVNDDWVYLKVGHQSDSSMMHVLGTRSINVDLFMPIKYDRVTGEVWTNRIEQISDYLNSTGLYIPDKSEDSFRFDLEGLSLTKWLRYDTYTHRVGLNVSVAVLRTYMKIHGDIPSIAFSVSQRVSTEGIDVDTEFIQLRTDDLYIPYEPNNDQGDLRATLPIEFVFSNESRCIALAKQIGMGLDEPTDGQGNVLPYKFVVHGLDGNGVISTAMSEVYWPFDLLRNETDESDSSKEEVDSTETSSIGSDVLFTVDSTDTTVNVQIVVVISNASYPFSLNIGRVDAVFDYMTSEQADVSTGRTLMSVALQQMNLCENGCGNTFDLAISMSESDKGIYVSDLMQAWVRGNTQTYRLHGYMGTAILDVRMTGSKNFFNQFSSSDSEEDSASTDSGTEEGADPASSFGFVGFDILGSDAGEGQPITIPCVMMGYFCPYDSAKLTGSGVKARFNISTPTELISGVDLTVKVVLPRLDIHVDCCVHNSLATIQLDALTFDSSVDSHLFLYVTLVPTDLAQLQTAVQLLMEAKYNAYFNIHGSPDGLLIASVLQSYEYEIVIEKSEAPEDPTGTGIDIPFSYELAGTTTNSATFKIVTALAGSSSMPDIIFGDVSIRGFWSDVQVVSCDTAINMYSNSANDLTAYVSLHGMDTLNDICQGSNLPNPLFCMANEFVSEVINYYEYPEGIDMVVEASYVNSLGTTITFHADLVLLAEDTTSNRDIELEEELGLIDDYAVSVLDAFTGVFTSILSSEVEIDVTLFLKNIFNFTVNLQYTKLDIYVSDLDGTPDYWFLPNTPLGAVDAFLLVDDLEDSASLTLEPGQVGGEEMTVGISWSTLPEALSRLYDEVYVKSRACIHIRDGTARLKVQFEDDAPLIYTQTFSIDEISAYGYVDCEIAAGCTASTEIHAIQGSSGDWQQNGDTGWSGSNLKLTDGRSYKSSAFLKTRVPVKDSWEATWDTKMSLECFLCAYHTDGFAFVVQTIGSTAIGNVCTTGKCHGYEGIGSESIGIILNNYATNDASVHVQGSDVEMAASTQFPDDFDDGNWHSFRVVYSYNLQRMWLYQDETFILIAQMNLDEYLNYEGTYLDEGYVGFTATTGTGSGSTIQIRNFQFKTVRTSVADSTISEQGQTLSASGTLELDAQDSCGQPRHSGGDQWSIVLIPPIGSLSPSISIVDHDDGTYTINYSGASVNGEWTVQATLSAYGETANVGTFDVYCPSC